jgi:hypothetical protein
MQQISDHFQYNNVVKLLWNFRYFTSSDSRSWSACLTTTSRGPAYPFLALSSSWRTFKRLSLAVGIVVGTPLGNSKSIFYSILSKYDFSYFYNNKCVWNETEAEIVIFAYRWYTLPFWSVFSFLCDGPKSTFLLFISLKVMSIVPSIKEKKVTFKSLSSIVQALFKLFKHCSSIVQALFKHCSSIVQALFKHCSSIVQALFKHCSSIVQALFRR